MDCGEIPQISTKMGKLGLNLTPGRRYPPQTRIKHNTFTAFRETHAGVRLQHLSATRYALLPLWHCIRIKDGCRGEEGRGSRRGEKRGRGKGSTNPPPPPPLYHLGSVEFLGVGRHHLRNAPAGRGPGGLRIHAFLGTPESQKSQNS